MNNSSILSVLAGIIFLFSSNQSGAQVYSGLWRTGTDVLLIVKDSGSTFIAKYVTPGDCPDGHGCELGGGADYYVKGTKGPASNTLNLTMLRCTHKKAMRDEGLEDHWTTPCKITSASGKMIEGTWRTNWYWNDIKNGKEFNFRRDAKEDKDAPFSMRKTNCADELSRLVAEINLKAETDSTIQNAINDEDQRIREAKETLKQEAKDQISEEVFQGLAPMGVKLAPPQVTGQETGSYFESWVDYLGAFGESTKNWGLQKVAIVGGVFDMIIDMTNLNAKGFQTLEEVEQINYSIGNMLNTKVSNFASWAQAMVEYTKLKEICSSEIPPQNQPKPIERFPMDGTEFQRKLSEKKEIQNKLNENIKSAKTASRNITSSSKKLHLLLDPYKSAQPTLLLSEVMPAAELKKTEAELKQYFSSWQKFFAGLKMISDLTAVKTPEIKNK